MLGMLIVNLSYCSVVSSKFRNPIHKSKSTRPTHPFELGSKWWSRQSRSTRFPWSPLHLDHCINLWRKCGCVGCKSLWFTPIPMKNMKLGSTVWLHIKMNIYIFHSFPSKSFWSIYHLLRNYRNYLLYKIMNVI